MKRFPAFLKIIQAKAGLLALLSLLICTAFYFLGSNSRLPYAQLTIPAVLQEKIATPEQSLVNQLQSLDTAKAALTKNSADQASELLITPEQYLESMIVKESSGNLILALPKYNYEQGERLLEFSLENIVDKNQKSIEERRLAEQAVLKEKLTKISQQVNSWQLELKSQQDTLLQKELAEELSKLQQLATTLAEKHPKVQEALTVLRGKYRQIGRAMPEYDQLLEENVATLLTKPVSAEIVEGLQSRINEANQQKLKLEADLASLSEAKAYIQIPKSQLVFSSATIFWLFSVILPSLLVLTSILAVAYYLFQKADRMIDLKDLRSQINVEKVYSFPKIDLATDGSQLKKNVISGSLMLVGGETQQGSTLPVKTSSLLPVPILKNSIETSREHQRIADLAAKIMINARALNKQVLFFSAPQQSSDQSVVVSNLAVAMARYSSKVLVLDASFNNYELSKQFNFEESTLGFADYLIRSSKLEDCMQPSWLDNLSIMPIGTMKDSAQRLLLKPRFSQILTTLTKRFDFVLISAGALEDDISSQLIASNSDLIFLVADHRSNTLAGIEEALLRLSSINLHPEAVIIQENMKA